VVSDICTKLALTGLADKFRRSFAIVVVVYFVHEKLWPIGATIESLPVIWDGVQIFISVVELPAVFEVTRKEHVKHVR